MNIVGREQAMKETITIAASQTKRLDSCPSAERTFDQHILARTALWIWRLPLLRKADYPATRQMAKSTRPRFLLVNVALCLLLLGPSLAVPFMGPQKVWAAPAHQAHQASAATHLISQRPHDEVKDAIDHLIDLLRE